MATDAPLGLTGELMSEGKDFTVSLSEEGLSWTPVNQKKEQGVTLAWSEVYGVSTQQQMEGGGGADDKHFTVHYISKQKNKKWCQAHRRFDTKQGSASEWIAKIQARYRPSTPKSLLVVINPIGGKGTGRQVYEKKVAPLFKLSGIATDVIITERRRHVEEIGNTFDFSKVEGVVTVGGDGMYQEMLEVVLLRTQKDAGIDVNDTAAKIVPPPNLNFGLIPAGTGNGVSNQACQVIDVETAALHIIRGETNGFNIFSVHEPGKLLTYSGLLVGYGFCSQLIKRTEELRWMKRMRYPYAMLAGFFGKKYEYRAELEYLEADNSGNSPKDQDNSEGLEGATAAITTQQEWKKEDSSDYMDMMVFTADIVQVGEKIRFDPYADGTLLMCSRKVGALKHFKFFVGFATQNSKMLTAESVSYFKNIVAFRVKVIEDSDSMRTEKEKERNLFVDIDGEVYKLSSPNLEVRLHPRFIQMYSSKIELPHTASAAS